MTIVLFNVSVVILQVFYDRAESPGVGVPVQRSEDIGTYLASVVRGHGASTVVPKRRGGARRTHSSVRGVRREMAESHGPTDVHRRPGGRTVRFTVYHHITDPSEDIVLSHRASQTPDYPIQGDQLQTRLVHHDLNLECLTHCPRTSFNWVRFN